MYSIKRFPTVEKDDWIVLNKERVEEELKKYDELFEEPLKTAFQEVITDYIYLQSIMSDVSDWKNNFVRFIAHTTNLAENELRQKSSGADFHGGRLSLIKELLAWF